MLSKRCFKCGECKPIDDFYKHKRMGDGHLNKCKECTKLDSFKNRLANIETVREYDRNRASLAHRKALRLRTAEEWRIKFPNRKNAHSVLSRALKAGTVVPLPCFVCGEKAEAHHPDYDAPLAVSWLCSKHHRQAHAIVKHLGSQERTSLRLKHNF